MSGLKLTDKCKICGDSRDVLDKEFNEDLMNIEMYVEIIKSLLLPAMEKDLKVNRGEWVCITDLKESALRLIDNGEL